MHQILYIVFCTSHYLPTFLFSEVVPLCLLQDHVLPLLHHLQTSQSQDGFPGMEQHLGAQCGWMDPIHQVATLSPEITRYEMKG